MPWDLAYVVAEARRCISYIQNLPGDMQPPRSLWHSRRKCAEWIENHQPGKESDSGGHFVFSDNERE